MSEIPFRQTGTGDISLDGTARPSGASAHSAQFGAVSSSAAVKPTPQAVPTKSRPLWFPHTAGLGFVCAAAIFACVPFDFWTAAAAWAGSPWTAESVRWSVTALLATIGVSFLPARPIFFVLSGALFAITVTIVDLLLVEKLTRGVESIFGSGVWPAVLVLTSSVFAYLVYVSPTARAPNVRGVLSLMLVAVAALGVMKGWFEGSALAQRIGPGAVRVLTGWDQEVRWAVAIVLTAVGVSMSRTRHVHLLNSLLLLALAYQCVRAGYVEVRTFPELSTAGQMLSLEHESYMNVDTWRWVVAAELVCLSAVLIHLSLGMGALCVGMSITWMAVGLTVYHAMGTMSLVRASNEAIGGTQPLANMGLPVPSKPVPGVSASASTTARTADTSSKAAVDPAVMQAARHVLIGELTQLGWMLFTAIFAGIIAVTGLRMISEDPTYRRFLLFLLWVGFMAGVCALAWVWPKDTQQSWAQWAAAFKFSRHHIYLFWLAFLGAMSLAGVWAMGRSPTAAGWVHGSIACVFLGTAVTLVGAAVLIRFAGYPPLPVWVYCVIAAGQSSLGWVLLLHLNPPTGRVVQKS